MSKNIRDILQALEEYKQTADSVGIDLRLDLSQIVVQGLRCKGWTQRELALRASLKESYISRVLHSNVNCTFETAGKLLFALDLRASIREIDATDHEDYGPNIDQKFTFVPGEPTHGKTIKQETAKTGEGHLPLKEGAGFAAIG